MADKPLTEIPSVSVLERLRSELERFGERDQRIARYFIDHAEELPFLSAGEIAETLGVSGPAITRFSQRFGFEGYPHLQRVIRQDLRATLGIRQQRRQDAVVADFWISEHSNLEGLQALNEEPLIAFAKALSEARQVWIIGSRSSYGIALIAEALLSSFRLRVRAYSADLLTSQPEQMLELGAKDTVLVYTMRRYTRVTKRIVEALQKQGANILLLTDQGASPLAKLAHQCLRVPTLGSQAIPSIAPLVSLTCLLVSLVAREQGDTHLKQTERLKADFSLYEY